MEREKLQKLIDSLESLRRVTKEASVAFDEEGGRDAVGGWWILDSDER